MIWKTRLPDAKCILSHAGEKKKNSRTIASFFDLEAGEDHAIDACIYGCLSRPWTPTKLESIGRIDGWREDRKPPSADILKNFAGKNKTA